MTNLEVAVLLEISESLVENELRLARAWLRRELKSYDPADETRDEMTSRTIGRKRLEDETSMV